MRSFLLIIGMLLFLPSMPCFAYSCSEEVAIPDLYSESDTAFIGRIKRKSFYFSLTKNKYLVEVVSYKKGDLPNELVVWTWSKCGANFVVGEKFVIFSKIVDGRHWTDINSSWQIHKNSQSFTLEYLEYENDK